jgi:hypothetical protein
MKYIKLFEAFDSEKLSKTLGYITKSSREEVLIRIKKVCKKIDFPFSKLNDSFFQYLPFQKALNLKHESKREICKGESSSLFSSGGGIKGEFCKEGRIKRNWGFSTRIVTCPNCKGTGLEPDNSTKPTHFKFWFSKEGKYIAITGLNSSTQSVNPYIFNKHVSFGWAGDISLYSRQNEMERLLVNAHFALILNIEDVEKSNYEVTSKIQSDRLELKSGSKLVVTDESIRKANIERYMSQIAKKADIIEDINKLPRVVMRSIGDRNLLFNLLSNNTRGILSNLSSYYINALEGDDSDKEDLSNYIKNRYYISSNRNAKISDNLKYVKEKSKSEGLEEELNIIDKLEKLNDQFYNKIKEIKLECIEDIDILSSKLDAIKGIFYSDRYRLNQLDYFIDQLVTGDNSNSYHYLNNYKIKSYKSQILIGLERASKVIERF